MPSGMTSVGEGGVDGMVDDFEHPSRSADEVRKPRRDRVPEHRNLGGGRHGSAHPSARSRPTANAIDAADRRRVRCPPS